MLSVGNKKAIARLADKSFRANRTRNIIAAIAIALTAILFTTLFTIGSGMVESFEQQTMRQSGSDAHGVFKNLNQEQAEKIISHPLIKEASADMLCADKVTNPEFLKRHVEMWYYSTEKYDWNFIDLAEGQAPQTVDEIVMDEKSLELLGVPAKVGQQVTISFKPKSDSEEVVRTFTLSGWFRMDFVANVGFVLVSDAYRQAHADELQYSFDKDFSSTGAIRLSVKFANSANMREKLNQIIIESGYSLDEKAPDFIASNENWAYLSGSLAADPSTLIALITGLLLILLTGYLIIYNIFQISVIRDIRFYGLLKTIGTTGRQIKRILRRQALLVSLIGIPIGLVIGFFVGRTLVPVIMANTIYGAEGLVVSPQPLIFLASAVFALLTVFISVSKPASIAARVSPIEAVRYTDGVQDSGKATSKRGTSGGKLPRMARANLGRNKRRTLLVVLSLSLSIVLLNTVFTLTNSFDLDKYVSKFAISDFQIAHANFFNYEYRGSENALSESLMEKVQQQPGFEAGGSVWHNMDSEVFYALDEQFVKDYNNDAESGAPMASNYGLDETLLQNLETVEGKIDLEKWRTGEYIMMSVRTDDNGNVYENGPWQHWNVGDQITLFNYQGRISDENGNFKPGTRTEHTYTLLAKVKEEYTDGIGWGDGYVFYMPSEIYTSLCNAPGRMSYYFNVSDGYEAEMNAYLKETTEADEPLMTYVSKQTYMDEFNGMRLTVVSVGGLLSLLIGLIGILNFVNAILTSIVTRRREFAMLESIGMTKKQLNRLLMLEGTYYALGTILAALLLSILCSLTVVRSLVGAMWFMSYGFILWPMLLTFPILLILGALVPLAVHHCGKDDAIVERIRETE